MTSMTCSAPVIGYKCGLMDDGGEGDYRREKGPQHKSSTDSHNVLLDDDEVDRVINKYRDSYVDDGGASEYYMEIRRANQNRHCAVSSNNPHSNIESSNPACSSLNSDITDNSLSNQSELLCHIEPVPITKPNSNTGENTLFGKSCAFNTLYKPDSAESMDDGGENEFYMERQLIEKGERTGGKP